MSRYLLIATIHLHEFMTVSELKVDGSWSHELSPHMAKVDYLSLSSAGISLKHKNVIK